ncbi:MAG: MBL fold metallo-hydrolase [candidate division Zixibacteria bacterium]|nr:MBL fold metallo-hydrolase [candidate division Zixibacteria bacterium]
MKKSEAPNRIKFLGTAGARIVVSKQLRASGGTWLTLENKNFLIDPGPGTLVKCFSSKPKLDPSKLDAIVLTHRHLDHSNDTNIMIEAMTEGGFKKRGVLFCPADALDEDPVVLKYVRSFVEQIHILKEGGEYSIDKIILSTPLKHIHGVETYGLIFKAPRYKISFVVDTKFFPELLKAHSGSEMIVINTVRYEPEGARKLNLDHLNLEDAKNIIRNCKPQIAILTHFGMTMLKAKPWELALQLKKELKTEVIAASDGMELSLDEAIF